MGVSDEGVNINEDLDAAPTRTREEEDDAKIQEEAKPSVAWVGTSALLLLEPGLQQHGTRRSPP